MMYNKKILNKIISFLIIFLNFTILYFLTNYVNMWGMVDNGEGLALLIIPFIYLPFSIILGSTKLIMNRKIAIYKRVKFIPIIFCLILPGVYTFFLDDLVEIIFISMFITFIAFILEFFYIIFVFKNKQL